MEAWQTALTLVGALFSGGALAKVFEWKKQQLTSGDVALSVLAQTVDKLKTQQAQDHLRLSDAEKSSQDCEKRYVALAHELERLQRVNLEQNTANSKLQMIVAHQTGDIQTLRQEQAILRERDRNLRRRLEIEDTGRFALSDNTPAEIPSKKKR